MLALLLVISWKMKLKKIKWRPATPTDMFDFVLLFVSLVLVLGSFKKNGDMDMIFKNYCYFREDWGEIEEKYWNLITSSLPFEDTFQRFSPRVSTSSMVAVSKWVWWRVPQFLETGSQKYLCFLSTTGKLTEIIFAISPLRSSSYFTCKLFPWKPVLDNWAISLSQFEVFTVDLWTMIIVVRYRVMISSNFTLFK